ncbi:MAG TPA: glycosyltransferase family 4 protein [Chitinophagaceae bacterium]|nr:glycosyltransferase family 4 protein [Chitinophagaceae bacterium]
MKTKVDILFVHHLPVIGGSTQSLLGLVKHVQQAGFSCKVLFLNHEGNAIDKYREEKIEVITVNTIFSYAHAYGAYNSFISRRPWRVVTNLIKSFGSVKKAEEIISNVKPSLIYLNTSVLIPFAIAGKKMSVPVIWHLREQIHRGNLGLRKRMVQTLFKNYASKIIAISQVNARALGLKNIEVVYNSVDFQVFNQDIDVTDCKKQYSLNATIQLCYIGGSVMSKGADVLVESILEVLKEVQDFQLIIAGHFNTNPAVPMNKIEKRVYDMMTANPILNSKLVFTGTLTNMAPLIGAADMVIWPATTPHFARPIMEAMVMGKPVVASNYLSSAEIVTDGVEGLLVDPTVKGFSRAILELIQHQTLREQMGLAGYNKAKALFNASVNNEKILQHIKTFLH